MICFIIPSIGRSTLKYSLNSLLKQTDTNWSCLVGFDGKSESDIDTKILVNDDRIKYLYFSDKLGNSGHHGNAGLVRNSILNEVKDSQWVGFLDDDDTLSQFYVEILNLELNTNDFDCCVFRMRYDSNDDKVIPPFNMNHIQQNFVGISFCVKKSFIDKHQIKFINSNSEDFDFLSKISACGGKIHLSSHITYNVNVHQYYG